jgi:NAD(P)-dependent dehydrogenase (short-subunit alcohol dehydrogenase family)
VNNAAILGPIGPLWESSPTDWWRAQTVNLRGPTVCTHAVIAAMIARRRGRIINVASFPHCPSRSINASALT